MRCGWSSCPEVADERVREQVGDLAGWLMKIVLEHERTHLDIDVHEVANY